MHAGLSSGASSEEKHHGQRPVAQQPGSEETETTRKSCRYAVNVYRQTVSDAGRDRREEEVGLRQGRGAGFDIELRENPGLHPGYSTPG